MSEPMRCHPSIILENLLPAVVAIAVISLVAFRGSDQMWMVFLLIPVAAVLFTLRWMRTTVEFKESEFIVNRDTVFKMKKKIPYSKLASVNVNRTIINRLFGTSTLQFNINSAMNAQVPEARLVFKTPMADSIRNELTEKMYGNTQYTPDVDVDVPSLIDVGFFDIIIHSLFSQPTISAIWGWFFLAISIIQALMSVISSAFIASSVFSLLFFAVMTVLPMVTKVFRYYNFKVYRVDDTIYLQHGFFTTYRTSFKISKVNAVRVKDTPIARLMGRCYMEAEVVGLGSADSDYRPVLCVMKSRSEIKTVMGTLVPEFVYDAEMVPQPVRAKKLYLVTAIILMGAVAAISTSFYLYGASLLFSGLQVPTDLIFWMYVAIIGVAAVIEAMILYWALNVYHTRKMNSSESLFTFVTGVLDRQTVIMKYDKVQMVEVTRGLIARHLDLATCSVSVLSSLGGAKVVSGNFAPEDLEQISETVMERIRTGKYDYHDSST
jgi:putative membrane protein